MLNGVVIFEGLLLLFFVCIVACLLSVTENQFMYILTLTFWTTGITFHIMLSLQYFLFA